MYALVDANSFYASCEQVFRPDLRGRPVAVLSNNDGCIIAANREAKALGIPLWKPAFEAAPLLRRQGVTLFSSNYPLYGDMSARVMETLATLTPDLEVYSIDEAFLRIPDSASDLPAYGQLLRRRVHQWTGLPVGVGIAPTKALAKLANRTAKRASVQRQQVFVIDNEAARLSALRDFPVEDVWGIGPRIAARLHAAGVHTALDFTRLRDDLVRRQLSVVGLRLKRELEGHPQLGLQPDPTPKHTIGTAKSFGHTLDDRALLEEALAWYVAEVAEKLRRQKHLAGLLTVFLETNRFRESDLQYTNQTAIRLPVPTDDTPVLTHYARFALDRIYRPGFRYKKVGVWLSDLSRPDAVPQDLFLPDPSTRRPSLMRIVDDINRRHGKATLRCASAGFRRDQWKLRQETLSPRYTTQFSEILLLGEPPPPSEPRNPTPHPLPNPGTPLHPHTATLP